MKLLVTGAGGFVGAAVVRAASAASHDVIAMARQPEPPRLAGVSGVRRVTIDIADVDRVRDVVRTERPDAIVHAAWAGLRGDARQATAQVSDNVLPGCRLIEAAAETGVAAFVGIGSQDEYGRLNRVISEDDVAQPTSLYGAAKLSLCHLGNAVAAKAGTRFVWLRLFATYGPSDNPEWLIPSVLRQLRSGVRPRTTAGTQRWDYLYIEDAAAAVLACLSSEAKGVFNLASGAAVPVRAIIERLRDLVAPNLELVFGEVSYGPDGIRHLQGSIEKLSRATGWTPKVDIEEGLRRTACHADA